MTRVNELVPGDLIRMTGRMSEETSVLFVHDSAENFAETDRLWVPRGINRDGYFVGVVPWNEICEDVRNGTNAVLESMSITAHSDVHGDAKTYVIYALTSVLNRDCPVDQPFNDLIFVPDDQRFAVVRELL